MVLEVLGFFAGFFIAFIGVSYLRLYVNPELRYATSLSQLYPSYHETFEGFVLLMLFFFFPGLALALLPYHDMWYDNAIIGGIVGFGSGFFFHPFYLLRLVRQRRRAAEEVDHLRGLDSQVLRVAKEYGGILSASHLVYELELSLEEALAALTRFVKYGEAREIEVSPGVRIWDFPIARAHLAKSDREVIDLSLIHI